MTEFPACPECGCRALDDPDQRECACDAGCNDGENAPGVQVLMDESARMLASISELIDARDSVLGRLADLQAECVKRSAVQDKLIAERDGLCERLAARDDEISRLRSTWQPPRDDAEAEYPAPRAPTAAERVDSFVNAAQTPAPGARSAPRARRAAKVGPEIETGAQAVTGPHSGGSETEGFSA